RSDWEAPPSASLFKGEGELPGALCLQPVMEPLFILGMPGDVQVVVSPFVHVINDPFPCHLLTISEALHAVDDNGMCDLASPLPGLFFVHLTARQRDRFQRFPEHPVLLGIGSKPLVVQVLRHKSCTAVML